MLPGTYVENVEFRKVEGTIDSPIWLMSAGGPDTVHVVAANNALPTISAFGEDNLIISGFTVEGGLNGIQVSQSGNNFSNLSQNIVIQNNVILNPVMDGIKISQADNVHVLNNQISHTGNGEEGIDFVAVNDSVIAGNEVSNVTGPAGIDVKGGSSNVLIQDNYVHDVTKAGITVGGWSDPKAMRPGTYGYEAKDVTVIGNKIEDSATFAIKVQGGQDSVITGNYLSTNNLLKDVIVVQPGSPKIDPPPLSSNVQIFDNVFDRDTRLIGITNDSTNISFYENATDGLWSQLTGLQVDHMLGSSNNDSTGSTETQTDPNPVQEDNSGTSGAGGTSTIVSSEPGVTVRDNGGVITAEVSLSSYQMAADIRSLVVDGAGGGEFVGNVLDNAMTGGDGAENLKGGLGNDVLAGGAGNDSVSGGCGGDQINGGLGGGDVLQGGGGNDIITDDDGVAQIYGQSGDDVVTVTFSAPDFGEGSFISGGAGSDVIDVTVNDAARSFHIDGDGPGREAMSDGADAVAIHGQYASADVSLFGGNDTFSGGGGADVVDGGSGDDDLAGGAGDDSLSGDSGNDSLRGDGGNDSLDGNTGADRLNGGAGNDKLNGGADGDNLDGGSGSDLLIGGAGHDTLIGSTENDDLRGGDGDDLLIGGAGADKMQGGTGRDTFVMQKGDVDGDFIFGFQSGEDKLQLEGYSDEASLVFDGQHWAVTDMGVTETFDIKGVTELAVNDFLFV